MILFLATDKDWSKSIWTSKPYYSKDIDAWDCNKEGQCVGEKSYHEIMINGEYVKIPKHPSSINCISFLDEDIFGGYFPEPGKCVKLNFEYEISQPELFEGIA